MTQPSTTLSEQFAKMAAALPKSPPFEPSAFAVGVVEHLRDIANLIESGDLTIIHFSSTWHGGSAKQRLEIEVG